VEEEGEEDGRSVVVERSAVEEVVGSLRLIY
jgi:hypothetical protein